MRKLFIFVLLLLLATGCRRIDNASDYKEIAQSIIDGGTNKVNMATRGYEYYLPKGVNVVNDLDFNQVFNANGADIYMYVDIVSYYYKNASNNDDDKKLYNYYYEKLNLGEKQGYIAIKEEEKDSYFVKIVIDYAKIEGYVKKNQLSSVVSYAVLILDSIKYNDKLIEKYITDNKVTSNDILYNIKKPSDSESKFNQYLQEYVDEENQVVDLPDE